MLRNVQKRNVYYDIASRLRPGGGGLVIGRGIGCDIRIFDGSEGQLLMSRIHAMTSLSSTGEYVLTDVGSVNGTFITRNSCLTQLPLHTPTPLQDHDVISFGFPILELEDPDHDDDDDDDAEIVTIRKKPIVNPYIFEFVIPTARLIDERMRQEATHQQTLKRRRHEAWTSPSGSDNEDPEEAPKKRKTKKDRRKNKSIVQEKMRCMVPSELADSSMTCSVCQDIIVGANILACGHMFCGTCLDAWIQRSRNSSDSSDSSATYRVTTCPECREAILAPPVRCRAVDALVEDIATRCSEADDADALMKRICTWKVVRKDVEAQWARLFVTAD